MKSKVLSAVSQESKNSGAEIPVKIPGKFPTSTLFSSQQQRAASVSHHDPQAASILLGIWTGLMNGKNM